MSDGILRCPPGPTDAELQADRDAKHAVAVREWMGRDELFGQGFDAGWQSFHLASQHVLQMLIAEAKTSHATDLPCLVAVSERLAHLANSRAKR